MEENTVLTETEQQKRLRIVEMLSPHFGKSIDQLLEAATLVLGHVEGLPREKLVDTEGKV